MWLARRWDQQLCPGLTLSPLPFQIEFVTGTKKGTTTNATATTTTTASTAVAGRSRLVCFQLHHRQSKGPLLGVGEQTPRGPGPRLPFLCCFLSSEFASQFWNQGGLLSSLAAPWLSVAGVPSVSVPSTLAPGLLERGRGCLVCLGPDFSLALFPDAQKRKSKWDSAIPVTTIAQPTILTTTATLPAVVTVTTSASGSKTTVISAVGTIVKKAKQ